MYKKKIERVFLFIFKLQPNPQTNTRIFEEKKKQIKNQNKKTNSYTKNVRKENVILRENKKFKKKNIYKCS